MRNMNEKISVSKFYAPVHIVNEAHTVNTNSKKRR